MPFTQFQLDKSVNQSRGIFDKYIYKTDDTLDQALATGYFNESRFVGDSGWVGGVMEISSSDGFLIAQITSDNSVTYLVAGDGRIDFAAMTNTEILALVSPADLSTAFSTDDNVTYTFYNGSWYSPAGGVLV